MRGKWERRERDREKKWGPAAQRQESAMGVLRRSGRAQWCVLCPEQESPTDTRRTDERRMKGGRMDAGWTDE